MKRLVLEHSLFCNSLHKTQHTSPGHKFLEGALLG